MAATASSFSTGVLNTIPKAHSSQFIPISKPATAAAPITASTADPEATVSRFAANENPDKALKSSLNPLNGKTLPMSLLTPALQWRSLERSIIRDVLPGHEQVLDVEDIPWVVSEAFYLATSDIPCPILIDITKDVQQQMRFHQPIWLTGYMSRLSKSPNEIHLEEKQIVRLILDWNKTLLSIPTADEYSLQMFRMHATVYAELLIIPLIEVTYIDPSEIGKNKQPCVSVCADLKVALKGINAILESKGVKDKLDFEAWREELNEQKQKFPLSHKNKNRTRISCWK
ncbi:hypothetical protein L6164_010937 [Bauhinia variegata]|uniref:Uncharacterized protein n=1 Tax=Bauhinia variegata TaxID=167791 RepID=A0ACB9P446_BAUVA|nr:hypothetical protein L6164_010937 [Bauhinia variegata]